MGKKKKRKEKKRSSNNREVCKANHPKGVTVAITNYATCKAHKKTQGSGENEVSFWGGFVKHAPVWSGILTAIATALLVLTSYLLWKSARNTLRQMKEDTEIAFQAYPYIQNPELFFESGKSPKLIFWLRNSGQSPVRDIVIRARIFYGVSPDRCSLVGDFDERTIAFDVPGGGDISEKTQLILINNPVPSDFAAILDSPPDNWSRRTIKVEGVIQYRTIFTPDSEPRNQAPILFFAEPVSSEEIGHLKGLMLGRDSRRHAYDTTNNGQPSECSY